jgi:hypothetical protein
MMLTCARCAAAVSPWLRLIVNQIEIADMMAWAVLSLQTRIRSPHDVPV